MEPHYIKSHYFQKAGIFESGDRSADQCLRLKPITGQKKNSKKAAVISFETLLKQIVTFKEKKNSNSGKIVHFSY